VKQQPFAACVLVFNPRLHVLVVERREDPSKIGLPGGKIGRGEHPREAAKRELYEETGLVATRLRAFFRAVDENDHLTVTYLVKEYEGRVRSSEEGRAYWVPVETLLQHGAFPRYFRAMLGA